MNVFFNFQEFSTLCKHLTPSQVNSHTCPEALIRLSELCKRSVNGFLLQFGHIFRICKDWNPKQKEKKVISLLVKFGGEKMGFGPLFWFGLDWNWLSSENDQILSHLDLNIWSIGWDISITILSIFWKNRGFLTFKNFLKFFFFFLTKN